jgi:hypothetical protein
MIVHYLNFKSIGFSPAEADPPLVVDPNTKLPCPITGEGFHRFPGIAPKSEMAAAACT